MKAIWTIAMHDLRLMVTERAAFVARLLMPIAFIIVVGIANDAFQTDDPEPPVMVLEDQDGSALSRFYVEFIEANALSASTVRGSNSLSSLQTGEADIAVVIPLGFESDLVSGRSSSVSLTLAVSDPQEELRLRSLLDAAGQRLQSLVTAGDLAARTTLEEDTEAVSRSARQRAADLLLVDRIKILQTQVELPDRYELIGFQQSVPGMGSMFVMLGVLAGASLLIEERKRYTLQRTIIAPVSPGGFIAGKILGRFVVGMMQYVVAIVTGLVIGIVFGIDFGSSPLVMLAVMASFALCVSSLTILIAAVVKREQQASGLETLLAVTLAPLGGAWWSLDIEIIPDIMRTIARFSPFYWVMEGFRAAIFDLGFRAAVLPIAVLLGVSAIVAAVGTTLFRFE